MRTHLSKWVAITLASLTHGHQSGFHPAMFCVNGTTPGVVDYNNNAPVTPLYMLKYSEYWMHNSNGCGKLPPDPGVFLDLPAGKTFPMELAENRRFTTLDGDQAILSEWGDGGHYPSNYSSQPGCITHPNLHTWNESTAAGTAYAISYNYDYENVTPEEFVVFTVLPNTPFYRQVEYEVPQGMPPCDPDHGCLCLFLWIAYQCGEPNIYIFPYRCRVIPDGMPTRTIAKPKAAVYCEGNQSACVVGPKMPIIWHQAEGNNIEVEGYDLHGLPKNPGYNEKCGFSPGAQNDIFVDDPADGIIATATGTAALPASTAASSLPVGTSTQSLPASDHVSGLPTVTGTPPSPASVPTSGVPTGTDAPTSPPSIPASIPTSSLPALSSTPSSLPAGCGMPSLPASDPGSSQLTATGTPTLPASIPTSGVPTGTDAPTWPAVSAPTSSLPASSGTPSLPSSVPASDPAGLGTPTGVTSVPPSSLPADCGMPSLPASDPGSSLPTATGSSPASTPTSGIPTGTDEPTSPASIPASAPTSSPQTSSSTPSVPSSVRASGSGMPTSVTSVPSSGLPAICGTPSLPASDPGSSLPAATGTPNTPTSVPTSGVPTGTNAPTSPASVPVSTPTSSLPASSGTSSLPSSVPASDPVKSGTPSDTTSPLPTQPVPTAHLRRMITRREKHDIF